MPRRELGPYEPKPPRRPKAGYDLGDTVEAYPNPKLDEAMRRCQLRNSTASKPTALETVKLSRPFREPRQVSQDVAANSNTSTRNALASPAPELPFDATQYLSPENRQLIEAATRPNCGSPQYSMNSPNVQPIFETPDLDYQWSPSQCQTLFDAPPLSYDQTQFSQLPQASFPQPSILISDPLDFRPASYPFPHDPSISMQDPILNVDQMPVSNTLSVDTRAPATVHHHARLRYETIGPQYYQDNTTFEEEIEHDPTHHTDHLTGFRGVSADITPIGLDADMIRYRRRQELLYDSQRSDLVFRY